MNKKTVVLCASAAVLASAITAFATTKVTQTNRPQQPPQFEQSGGMPGFNGGQSGDVSGQNGQFRPDKKPDKKPGGDRVPPNFDKSGNNTQGQPPEPPKDSNGNPLPPPNFSNGQQPPTGSNGQQSALPNKTKTKKTTK